MTGRITARRFVAGRGNLTKVTRYDVVNASTIVAGETKYNTTGSPVAQITPWDGTNTRTVKIFYADNFNSSGNPATYAYPTTLTDPNSQSSTVKYRYDIGANVEATSPAPAGQSVGKTTKRVFDSVGRLERDSIYVSTAEKAYTRYAFPTNGIQAQSYSTLVDANSNGYPDSSDEVYAESWYDGAGRTRQSRTEHPGSTGGWTGTLTDYDILGRVARTSVPTEINSSYQASGDDATRGFIYNYQYFDWKNRPIRTVPSDSTSSDGKDTLITYEGCGCAGGQVTTVKGPVTTAVDVGGTTQTTKRRTQKAYEDILGRTYKTEVWDLDGGGSAPYSTTKTTFNGRDQATLIRQYSGGDTSSTYQDTTMSYDGHGRLYQSHKPEQRDGTTLKYTTYSYNPDNSILNATDGRGAVTAYTYNNQGLPTNIAWTVPGGSGITDPADVTFSYDALGNRTEMNDGPGKVIYSYDSLSKLISELREFDDVIPGAPEANNGYELNYTYHMGGTLKSMTEPLGVTVNYSADKTGRLTGVAPASAFGGVSTFASNAQYRAWGALKHLEYGNGVVMNQTFTNRQQSDTFTLGTSGTGVMNKTYDYYADGSLRHVDDALNGKFDRLNTYDHQGRIYQAKSSAEASGGTTSNPYYDRPYLQTYTFDAFDNLQNRENKLWNASANTAQNYTFTNNRITNTSSPFSYDNDGRVVQTPYTETLTDTTYDAAGRIDLYHSKASPTQQEDKITRHYDGDGREAKRVTDRCRIILPEDPEDPCTWQGGQNSYYIRSTVLGGAVVADSGGRYVYAGGAKLATLTVRATFNPSATHDSVQFHHDDPAGVSQRVTRNSPENLLGQPSYDPNYIDPRHAELDPMSNNAGLVTNYSPQYLPSDPNQIPIEGESPIYINGQRASATLDGLAISGQALSALVNSGRFGGWNGISQILMSQNDARFSHYSVASGSETWNFSNGQFGEAWARASEMHGTLVRNFVVADVSVLGLSWGPQQQAPDTRISKNLLERMRPELAKILTPDCMSHLKDIFDAATRLAAGTQNEDRPYSFDPLVLFDKVNEQGGFHFGNNSTGVTTYSSGSGSVGGGNARISLSSNLAQAPFSQGEIHALAYAAFSETLHVAGYKPSFYIGGAFSNVNLAAASHSLGLGQPNFAILTRLGQECYLLSIPVTPKLIPTRIPMGIGLPIIMIQSNNTAVKAFVLRRHEMGELP